MTERGCISGSNNQLTLQNKYALHIEEITEWSVKSSFTSMVSWRKFHLNWKGVIYLGEILNLSPRLP